MPADPPTAYFDTSVFVRSYVVESGTPEALRMMQEHAVISSVIAGVELVSALRRLRRERRLSPRQLEAIEDRMTADRRFWTLLDVDRHVLQRAEDALRQGVPLRALDAVHLATALTFQAEANVHLPFMTGDEQQRRAAVALGLDVVFIQ